MMSPKTNFVLAFPLVLLLFVVLPSNRTFAQDGTPQAGLIITYLHTSVSGGDVEASSDCPMYVLGSSSFFVEQDDRETGVQTRSDDNGNLTAKIVFGNDQSQVFFTDHDQGVITSRVLLLDKFLIVEESIPDFKWQITGENKFIAEHQCYEATTVFRGRKYSAWFTPEIPISGGPWKFSGLPGLILEVKDLEEQYNWYCKSLKPLKGEQQKIIDRPSDSKPMSYSDFYDLQLEKIREYFQRMTYGTNVEITSDVSFDNSRERTK